MLESIRQDVVYGVRLLRRSPGFSAAAALMLALGIGINTAVFSVVNAAVLRPWPVPGGERMVVIAEQDARSGRLHALAFRDLESYRDAAPAAFEDIAGYSAGFLGLAAGDAPPSRVLVTWVTGNYFSLLDLPPAHGRLIAPDDVLEGRVAPIVVLGHSAWRRRFGADPTVIGTTVRVNGTPCTIVGVAPAGFRGTFAFSDAELYLPLNWSSGDLPSLRGLHSFARLRNGATIDTAQAAMDVVFGRTVSDRPEPVPARVWVVPERLARPEEDQARSNRAWSSLIVALVAIVLVIASVNVTNLLVARTADRRAEFAIRAALGASRIRLIRQMATEAALLAAAGGFVGMACGSWATNLLVRVRLPGDLPVRFDFSLDGRVLAYALGTVAISALLVGVTAALRASRVDPGDHLRNRHGGATRSGRRLREALVMAQVAASFVLLAAAMLSARSLVRAEHADLGFQPGNVLNVHMDVGQLGYTEARGRDLFAGIERAVRMAPGVERVSYAFTVPMGYVRVSEALEFEDAQRISRRMTTGKNVVGPEYFEVMGIPLVEGRRFSEADDERARPVVIVNEQFAARAWPGEDARGRRIRSAGSTGPWSEVIGVARTGKYTFLFEDPLPYVYAPIAQQYTELRVLQVRTSLPPETLAGPIQRIVQAREPDLPLYDVQSMARSLEGGPGFFPLRVFTIAAAALALLGLVLALAGIYGLVAYLTNRRTHEIGVRVALGASRADVLHLVLGDGLRAVVAGVLAGGLVAAASARLADRFLFDVSPFDPLTYAVVAPALVTLALLAAAAPAWRAMRVSPADALRSE